MGCQREIAQRITQGGADYVLAVKENQGQLYEGIRDLFEGAEALGFDGTPYDHAQTVRQGTRSGGTPGMLGHHRSGLPGLSGPPGAMAATEGRHQSGGPSSNPRGCVSVSPATTSAALPASAEQLLAVPSEAIGASKTRCTGPWT